MQELSCCQRPSDCAGAVALSLALQTHSVTTMNLNSNEVGDDGAAAIAAMLEVNPSLTSIYVVGNRITTPGAAALASALRRSNTSVVVLAMQLNDVDGELLEEVACLLQRNSEIKEVAFVMK
jgi:hypothetical protein